MYLRQCFLRNARKELCLFLSGLNYTPMYMVFRNNIAGNNLVLECGTWHFTDSDNHPNSIDCGENEDLFCAIAALRDDSNFMQWFTNGTDWYQVTAMVSDGRQELINYFGPDNFHKASVEELIEHFKK